MVSETLKGIRRAHGTAQHGKTAILTPDLLRVLAMLPANLSGQRDRALLLIGYAGAFLRSELAALNVESLRWEPEGLTVHIARSKRDQDELGRRIGIVHGTHPDSCPVQALRTWLTAADIAEGPLFRSVSRRGKVNFARLNADSIAFLLKRAVSAAGYDPANYAGHSLRAGFATQSARNGASPNEIMRQTGHTSVQTVACYIREAQLFQNSPASKLDL